MLQRKPHIVVATPGRLLDLVDDGALFLQPQPSSTTATVGACPCLVINYTTQPALHVGSSLVAVASASITRMSEPPA